MAIFDDIDGTNAKLPELKDRKGRYLLNIELIKDGASKRTGKGFFKVEGQIVEATGPEAYGVGTRVVHVIHQDDFGFYKKEIPQVVAAVINEPVGNVKPGMVAELVGPKQPAKGIRVWAETGETGKAIKNGANAGKMYIGVSFSPAEQSSTPVPDAAVTTSTATTKTATKTANK